jgi:hypothetical protein
MSLTRRQFLWGAGATVAVGAGAAGTAAYWVWHPESVVRAIIAERLPNAAVDARVMNGFIDAFIPWDRSVTRRRRRFYAAFPVVSHSATPNDWVPEWLANEFVGLERRVITAFLQSTNYDVSRPDEPQKITFFRFCDPYEAICFNRFSRFPSVS